jgi:hypothetical protein
LQCSELPAQYPAWWLFHPSFFTSWSKFCITKAPFKMLLNDA